MRLLGAAAVEALAADEVRRARSPRGCWGEAAELRLGEVDQVLVLKLAGRDQDQPVGHVMRGQPAMQVAERDRADAALVAEYRPADRLVREGSLLQMLEHHVGAGVARLGELLQDD